jgi:predicted O-linked N-acetylglucosamine transferase (SPINDLY family)
MTDTHADTTALIAQGIAHQQAERFDDAERCYRAALQIDPGHPEALALMGMISGMFGQFAAAIDFFERALQRDPYNADVHHNLGETYRHMGMPGKAFPAFNRALELRPDHLETYRSAADAAIATATTMSDPARAAELRRLAARYLLPLGAHLFVKRSPEAEAALREAVALDPGAAGGHYALGSYLEELGRTSEAAMVLQRATELDPGNPEYFENLAHAFYGLQRIPEMEQAYRTAIALAPERRIGRQNLESCLVMAPLYRDDTTAEQIFSRHRDWGVGITAEYAAEAATAAPFVNSRDPERKLRIAFLSGDFGNHPVGFFFLPLLAHHDRAAFDVYCYSETTKPDNMTQAMQGLSTAWRETFELGDEALRAQLRADEIDIIVDLAGQTAKNRLRALAVRAAPVTATWLGYPATTGLAAIDWRITDAIADPPGAEAFYTEKLLRLPDGFLCYDPTLPAIPAVAPAPALAGWGITFGSFNNPLKMSDETIRVWAAILNAVPQSRLFLKAHALIDPGLRQRLVDRFAAHGIGVHQLEMRAFAPDFASHFAAYGEVDIALDPFPYNGTTTSCEAMWMGVPLVALIGDRHTGRVGFDLLSRIGLPELAAADTDAYIATAVALAGDLPRLTHLRGALRDRMRASPLCDAAGFARAFERGLRQIWRDWCRN